MTENKAHIDFEQLKRIAIPEDSSQANIERDMLENRDLYKASFRIAMMMKKALKSAGLTQVELAERMGVDPALISRYMSGKANMELKTMVRLEKELGITIINRRIAQPRIESENITVRPKDLSKNTKFFISKLYENINFNIKDQNISFPKKKAYINQYSLLNGNSEKRLNNAYSDITCACEQEVEYNPRKIYF